ncbi:universal stress protein [Lignipirellula cremea]|uniref:Universal stress protein n=1 Tax=Lignipirellula cremea TaxID=2528010 RepID=A0A518E461_9BACT|nr:universal stress protein [Lignipirellula cremea]QDU98868.1 Putative universal stress protein [Lignipirellula cremea]
MKLSKIVFPTDFSHTGDAALSLATSLARDSGAVLLIVHVEEPPLAYGTGDMYYGPPSPDTEELQAMLVKVTPDDPDVPYQHHLITGHPPEALARLVEEENADLIVMGTHGRTGLTRLLMGSIAEQVVRRAPCPVLTYKQPATKLATD